MRRRCCELVVLLALASCGDPKTPPKTEEVAVPGTDEAAVPKAPPVDTDEAHLARGDRPLREVLTKCRNECPKSFQMQDPDEIAIAERLRTIDANPWADAAEFQRFSEMVERVRAREERMRTDPRALEAEKKRSWVRENPMFKGVSLTWTFADPYVIFQEVKRSDERDTKRVIDPSTGLLVEEPIDGTLNPSKRKQNEEWAAKGTRFAQRDAIVLTEVHRRFRELFAERFRLPELASKGRMLTVLVMWNHESFGKLLAEAGWQVAPTVRSFYSPPNQKVFTYIGDESLQGGDEWKCADGRVQKLSDQSLAWAGTMQLLHEYGAIHRGTPLADGGKDVKPHYTLWFERGFAEFMSGIEVDEAHVESLRDAAWLHNRVVIAQIDTARRFRERAEGWKLAALMKPVVRDELVPNHGSERGTTAATFDCRAWAFCHFLWNYDEGKYRSPFLDFLELYLDGKDTSEAFAVKIMKRPNAEDWGDVEMEFEWYWRELVERKVGRNKVTKEWERPETAPPGGHVEDDHDFLRIWREKHKPR